MEQETIHHHQHLHTVEKSKDRKYTDFGLAASATLHCLLGCGLGEVAGMTLGTALRLSNFDTIIIAIVLGFVFGFGFGLIPFLRSKYPFARAARQVLVVEGLSIAVMEAVEVLVQVYTPGVLEAHLHEPIYWIGMGLSLLAGFGAAFPVNYLFVKKGIRHRH